MTREEHRSRSISNAIVSHDLGYRDWFKHVYDPIQFDLKNARDVRQKAKIVLEWLKSCEKLGTEIVKEEIKKFFNK